MERPELANNERFATSAARLGCEDELDEIVAGWTRGREAAEAEASLQARGIAASAVQTSYDLFADTQLRHRGHFAPVQHATLGEITVEASRFKLSRTPARTERSGPTLGQDNQYVLETLLGYGAERIAELVAAGVLE